MGETYQFFCDDVNVNDAIKLLTDQSVSIGCFQNLVYIYIYIMIYILYIIYYILYIIYYILYIIYIT